MDKDTVYVVINNMDQIAGAVFFTSKEDALFYCDVMNHRHVGAFFIKRLYRGIVVNHPSITTADGRTLL